MDIKWKKWINTFCITVVIILMALTAIEGVIASNKYGTVIDTTSSNTSFENSQTMEDIETKLIYDWMKEQKLIGSEEYYHTDEVRLPSECSLKAELVIKPYGKKVKKSTTYYGTSSAESFPGGKSNKITIRRDPSYKLNKDGSFQNIRQAEEDGYDRDIVYEDESDFYMTETSGTSLDITNFPSKLFINSEKKQRLESLKITMNFSKSCIDALKKQYNEDRQQMEKFIKEAIIIVGIEVFGTVLLFVLFALQKQRTRFFQALDRIWWEVIAGLTAIVFSGIIAIPVFMIEMSRQYAFDHNFGSEVEALMLFAYMAMPVLIALYAVCVQTTTWRLKEHKFLDSTLCVGYFRKWYRNLKERKKLEYEAMSFAEKHAQNRIRQYRAARRILILFIFLSICSIPILAFFGIGLAVLGGVGIKYLTKYSDQYAKEQVDLCKLMEQIERISDGELAAVTDIPEDSLYYDYSRKLTNIGNGMEKAMEAQLRGERMKIDLITNVSHDLKTPLTSIIGYVDLLSKDDTLSPEAKDYVQILTQKTERLKNIIADLFELAKSTSGDAKVELEPMDMRKLVEQTLGDMGDQIEDAGFVIRFRCNAEHTKFLGDVNRMYRVVQNILENALKYSLKGTRIFIQITEEMDKIKLEVINTASYEMDFTEDEIMERFARAEKSRTSEGNGLGLSIADSFTKNCGGDFKIKIRGDQFKATVCFSKYTK